MGWDNKFFFMVGTVIISGGLVGQSGDFFFFKCLHVQHMEVSGPGIEPVPLQQPKWLK